MFILVLFCCFVLSLKVHAIVYTQCDWIKKWNKCVKLVQQAQRQYREHLQFKSLLAREANIGGHAVASSSSNAGATNKTSRRFLHHKMANRVRSILIEKARAAVERSKRAGEPQKVTDELIKEYRQLEHRDQGWKRAWGIVDRALAGMKCFCGTFHILSPAPTTT